MSKKEIGKRITLAVGIALLVALLAILIIARGREQQGGVSQEATGALEERSEPMNILVAGADRTTGLHDVLMLVHVDPSAARVTVLQIPRDTYASYTDGSYRKLNGAAKRLGGMDSLCAFLSDSFGIAIDRYVSLDANVLSEVVDAMDGVEITLPDALYYEDPVQGLSIHLPAGTQTLDGTQAEYFVRYRMGYVRGDLGRMDAQKLFLAALARKMRSSMSVLSAARLAATLLPRMDTNLTVGETARLIRTVFSVNDESALMLTLPGEETVATQSGASYYALSAPATSEVLVRYFGAVTGEFDEERVFCNARYSSFCEIYDAYRPYAVYSVGQIAEQGIEIDKTQR